MISGETSYKHQNTIICILLVFAILLVYWQVQTYGLIFYDDSLYITENPYVKAGLTWDGLKFALLDNKAGYWHPLTWLSLMADRQLFLGNTGGCHWTNVLFHIANTIILFLVLAYMTGKRWQCAFVAAVFALHPLNVEPVASVSSRKDVLSGFFWLTAIGSYAFYSAHPSWRRYFLTVLAFILGMMAKPMVATLPVVFLLLDYWPLKRFSCLENHDDHRPPTNAIRWKNICISPKKILILEKCPFFAIVILIGLISIILQREAVLLTPLESSPLHVRIILAVVSYFDYLKNFLIPINLAPYYPHAAKQTLHEIILSLTTMGGVSLAVFAARKKYPFLIVGWFWYLTTLLPVVGLITVYTHAIADRYMYLPMIGLIIMIGYGIPAILPSIAQRRIVPVLLVIVLMASLAALSWKQTAYWQSSLTLWKHALKITEDNAVARNNYGLALAAAGRIAEAEEQYRRGLKLNPGSSELHNNIGLILADRNRIGEAIAHYNEALRIRSNDEKTHNNLGIALADQGNLDEASAHFSAALYLRPDYADALNNMGSILARRGEIRASIGYFEKALHFDANSAMAHHNLGMSLYGVGQYHDAVRQFQQALDIQPDFADARKNLEAARKQTENMQQPAP